jgi:hypothetical protein
MAAFMPMLAREIRRNVNKYPNHKTAWATSSLCVYKMGGCHCWVRFAASVAAPDIRARYLHSREKWPTKVLNDIKEQQAAAVQRAILLMLIRQRILKTSAKGIGALPVELCLFVLSLVNALTSTL